MENIQVAKRYVSALFSTASEDNALDTVREDLVGVNALLTDSKEFAGFVGNPLVPEAQSKAVIEELFKGKVHDLTFKFLNFVQQKDRLAELPAICYVFEEFYAKEKGILPVELSIAHAPNDKQVEAIKQKLADRYKKEINLEVKVDESLIGGFRLNINNQIEDYSVVAQLKEFKNKVLNS